MKIEEKKNRLHEMYDNCECCRQEFARCHECKEVIDNIENDIEKSEKYKWHDLRKNHYDLPLVREGEKVICYWEDKVVTISDICLVINNAENIVKVIAWKYIEPFGEGNKERHTLHQICRMIASGDIPKEVYDKYLSNEPIGFMTPLEMMNYLLKGSEEDDNK